MFSEWHWSPAALSHLWSGGMCSGGVGGGKDGLCGRLPGLGCQD